MTQQAIAIIVDKYSSIYYYRYYYYYYEYYYLYYFTITIIIEVSNKELLKLAIINLNFVKI